MADTKYAVKAVPQGAWDTHNHIFEPDRFPFGENRHYTPSIATLEQFKAFEKSIGVQHVCIAHGLTYGTDCTSLLYYLREFHGSARGIGIIDEKTVTNEVLEQYHAAGIRSVRLDLTRNHVINDPEKFADLIKATAARLANSTVKGWSVQVAQPSVRYWTHLRQVAKTLPVPLVVDHIASVQGKSMAPDQPDVTSTLDFAELIGALSDGNTWIKISAPYRGSYEDFEYADLKEIIRRIVDTNLERVVWGSDWPHTQRHQDRAGRNPGEKEPFLKIDDKAWINSLSTWLSEEEWQAMWVDNPRKLYDYSP